MVGVSDRSPVTVKEIQGKFRHKSFCLLLVCVGDARFTRKQHLEDVVAVTKLFQSRGFPAVKVATDYDPHTSFNRRTHAGRLHDPGRRAPPGRRRLRGQRPGRFPESALRGQLTFAEAASADDLEIAASAAAIQTYYQEHGHFDAIVTWNRERFRLVDHVVFRIDAGPNREVRKVDFLAVDGDLAVPVGDLADRVTATPHKAFSPFATYVNPTTTSLANDAERIRRLYREHGYGEARVAVRVGPRSDDLVGSAAVVGALIGGRRDPRDLYVRFDIAKGPRTLVDSVAIEFVGPHRATCRATLEQIAGPLGAPDLARSAGAKTCTADLNGADVPTLPDKVDAANQRLKDWFWSIGRPRADASVAVEPSPTNAHHSAITFTVHEHGDVHIGKVVVRGNFRTRTSIILGELGFHEGAPLTGDLYSSGPRRLRAMGLFSAVNVELLNFDEGQQERVNVLVRVEERYENTLQGEIELGYTQVNSVFGKVIGTFPNIAGTGLWAQTGLTLGARYQAIEGTGRVPRWLTRRLIHLSADTELQGYYRRQDTTRFGLLKTYGASVALSRVWQRPRTEHHDASSLAGTLRYDFRLRSRDEDAMRVAGPSGDETQAKVNTFTGSVGLTLVWDHRLDHAGNLNPLVPERGYRLEGGVQLASPYLFGQDTFLKVNASGQTVWTPNDRLQLHLYLRLDEGFPLAGAVLLPEVERFFAGGDTTVRGYDEDRLATEIVDVGVPPFGIVHQIRVLPAGGNIRVLGSADIQLRVWKLGGIPVATAAFVDAGLVTNTWPAVQLRDIRPSVGISLFRWLTPFSAISIDYAVPIRPRLGDNPLGHFSFNIALRN